MRIYQRINLFYAIKARKRIKLRRKVFAGRKALTESNMYLLFIYKIICAKYSYIEMYLRQNPFQSQNEKRVQTLPAQPGWP